MKIQWNIPISKKSPIAEAKMGWQETGVIIVMYHHGMIEEKYLLVTNFDMMMMMTQIILK